MQDQNAIDVDDLVAGKGDLFKRRLEKNGGIGTLPARVRRRKKGADIARANGAQQSVGNGMEQQIAVGMAGEALGMIDLETADHKRDAGVEGV